MGCFDAWVRLEVNLALEDKIADFRAEVLRGQEYYDHRSDVALERLVTPF
jgi:hypothetical protein